MEGAYIPNALAKARSALRGLECTRAELRLAAADNPAFGNCNVLAHYTQDAGWASRGPIDIEAGGFVGIWAGTPYPLGATYDGNGTNFAVFSEAAQSVVFSLFDGDGAQQRIPLENVDAYVWHCYLPHVLPGEHYGYRMNGPYQPKAGLKFNPNKLLLDTYAKATDGQVLWGQPLFSYNFGDPVSFNTDDSAGSTLSPW